MNFIAKKIINLFSYEKRSVIDFNNIVGTYENFLITKENHFVGGFEIGGVSYTSISAEDEINIYQLARMNFLKTIKDVDISIFYHKSQDKEENQTSNISNPFAKSIIEKWEKGLQTSEVKIFLIITNKQSVISSINKAREKQSSSTKKSDEQLNLELLKRSMMQVGKILSPFFPRELNGEELLNFFASYANLNPTNVSSKEGILRDHYLNSDIEFKKDYIIHTTQSKTIYSRFLGLKTYDTEEITTEIIPSILKLPVDLYLNFQIEPLIKEVIATKISQRIKFVKNEKIAEELNSLLDDIKGERQSVFNFSFCVLLSCKSLQDLDFYTNTILSTLSIFRFLAVKENGLNQRNLFISNFPSKGSLNTRKRKQTASAITTLINFEKNPRGIKKNSWGLKINNSSPITFFKTPYGETYSFNLHGQERSEALGHTLLVADSESGKTTLTSFLLTNILKYPNVNILALDKKQGMHNFCKFLDGSYNDLNENFNLNPFSLPPSEENLTFLQQWLYLAGDIISSEHEEKIIIKNTLERLYRQIDENSLIDNSFSFSDFIDSLETQELKERFEIFRGGLFDNKRDDLNFSNPLTIFNMDAILKNSQLASLSAFYIFHKIQDISRGQNKGFCIFVDELRDYLNHPDMADRITEAILEIRKRDGVFIGAVQNLDFFKEFSNSSSFLSNMENHIIFPTNSPDALKAMHEQFSLRSEEIAFLENTQSIEYKILFQNKTRKESAILDINLTRLGKYLKIFNSSASAVEFLNRCQREFKEHWREAYLGGSND